MRPVKKTFPVNLMLEGRKAVVVGGGRVGQHKVELLLDSGAAIALICPECVDELTALAAEGRITHLAKKFEPDDLAEASLVFACTDDKHVNRAVLAAAREQGVLCCCADGNWAEGDFVTPAIVRSGDFLLAVSTSGKSCRQARMMKESLKRHLDEIRGADLFVIGTSHNFLSAESRARYHLPQPRRETAAKLLSQVWGIQEFAIFNTCNRVEVVAVVSPDVAEGEMMKRILHFDELPPSSYYIKRGFDAFEHLCAVTAGMKSQTPGEFHVVSQLKDAVAEAESHGWSGPVLHELQDTVLHVQKDIRHETESILSVSEIEDVALKYLDFSGGLEGALVTVIGTGMVGKGLMEGLVKRGCNCTWVYHEHLPELKPEFEGHVKIVQMRQIPDILGSAQIVISAVLVEQPVVSLAEHSQQLNPEGTLFIDLGMPHNIDPSLAKGQYGVVGLDELKNWYRGRNGSMALANERCKGVIERSRDLYDKLRQSIQ